MKRPGSGGPEVPEDEQADDDPVPGEGAEVVGGDVADQEAADDPDEEEAGSEPYLQGLRE